MRFSFTVPGRPQSHQRHRSRIIRSGGKMVSIQYDPPANKKWRAKVQDAWNTKARECEAWDSSTPCGVEIDFIYKCAKAPRKLNPRPSEWRSKKPDIDNLAKGILDALNGLAWDDDAQVVEMRLRKIEAEQGVKPRTDVRIFQVLDSRPSIRYHG